MKKYKILFSFISISNFGLAQNIDSVSKKFILHAQVTLVNQHKPSFVVPYTGTNSFLGKTENAASFTSTLYMGAKMNSTTFLIFNPELSGGEGLSKVLGMGSNPNGETFRVSSTDLKVYIARLYLRKIINLGNQYQEVNEDFNQFKQKISNKYIALTLGKVSIADYFDLNKYSHDPRTQFLTWGLMGNGAWDYPANTRGYSPSAVIEYFTPKYELRFAYSLMPTTANGAVMDWNFKKSGGYTFEYAQKYTLKNKPGVVRLLAFYNTALMGNYKEATQLMKPIIELTRNYKNSKIGYAINIEQGLTNELGSFFRTSWNDGKTETWAFTEIDKCISGGLVLNGTKWNRTNDNIGIAYIASGLSSDHQAYLAAGGLGFGLGDGKLNYAAEQVAEIYYLNSLVKNRVWLTGTYQWIKNPGYNADRKGPAQTFSLRLHVSI